MARVVRKVSNKATKGQKRGNGLLHSKKFWIIVISIVVVLAAAGITIGIIVANNKKSDTTVEVDDYFGKTQNIHDTDVNFTKMSYQGVRLHTNPEEGQLFNDFTFVFATDLATFYPFDILDDDDEIAIHSVETHKSAFENLKELQYEIDKYNALPEAEHKLALYIVNTDQVDGNSSYNIYSDSTYVIPNTMTESMGPLFSIVGEDGIIEKFDGKTVYSTSFTQPEDTEKASISSAISVALNLVRKKDFDHISYYDKK